MKKKKTLFKGRKEKECLERMGRVLEGIVIRKGPVKSYT